MVTKMQANLKRNFAQGRKKPKSGFGFEMTCLSGLRSSRAALGDQSEPPGIIRAARAPPPCRQEKMIAQPPRGCKLPRVDWFAETSRHRPAWRAAPRYARHPKLRPAPMPIFLRSPPAKAEAHDHPNIPEARRLIEGYRRSPHTMRYGDQPRDNRERRSSESL